SPTGAVIHDLQETILDRFPTMAIAVYPAQVQGTASPGSLVRALRRCNADADADVVVIARGGGSFEELWAFNTEVVARAIMGARTGRRAGTARLGRPPLDPLGRRIAGRAGRPLAGTEPAGRAGPRLQHHDGCGRRPGAQSGGRYGCGPPDSRPARLGRPAGTRG